MLKPVFNKPDEEMQKKIDEKVKAEVGTKIKNEVDERVKTILKERDDADKKERADRIAKAVDVAKTLKAEAGTDKEKTEKEKNDILCPTCHTGHLHKMEQTGLTVKCVGDKCGKEYILLDTTADYRCQTCGIPLLKPEDPASIDKCPYCHGRRAVKFDWGKIRKVVDARR